MLVVDASVLATALGDDGDQGDTARTRLRGGSLAAPDLVDLEVLSVLRERVLRGAVEERRARLAVADLIAIPMRRVPSLELVDQCWELRANVTPYDAAYVAVAELFDAVLLTTDGRLSRAPGVRCRVEVIG